MPSGRQFFWCVLLGSLGAWFVSKKIWLPPWGSTVAPAPNIQMEPIQEALESPQVHSVKRGDNMFQVINTHRYEICGHVLSTQAYDATWTSEFSDVDIGLIWGTHINEFQNKFRFNQSGRFLFWRSENPVSDAERNEITSHIANVHTIPHEGSKVIQRALRHVNNADSICLRGFLSELHDENGTVLQKSSLTRTDTGDGACELMWVDEVQIGTKRFLAAPSSQIER
jgi:hypothetical protein